MQIVKGMKMIKCSKLEILTDLFRSLWTEKCHMHVWWFLHKHLNVISKVYTKSILRLTIKIPKLFMPLSHNHGDNAKKGFLQNQRFML